MGRRMDLLNKTNMKNEFVIYEQALALKELGFDEPCLAFYSPKEELYPVFQEPSKGPYFNNGNFIETLRVPLYQQAFRWFREKHNLVFNFISYNIVKPGEYHWSITWNDEAKASGIVKTYEEAEQACLSKLIEIVNDKRRNS
jgi:hypothetical protein